MNCVVVCHIGTGAILEKSAPLPLVLADALEDATRKRVDPDFSYVEQRKEAMKGAGA